MQQVQKPRITIEDIRSSETIKCEKCGGIYFREVIYLKKVSRLITGEGVDVDTPFPIYKCDDCGHVNKGFNIFEDKDDETKITLND